MKVQISSVPRPASRVQSSNPSPGTRDPRLFLGGALLFTLLLFSSVAHAQSRQYSLGGLPFDGGKFAARYKLQPGDFWVQGDILVLKDGVVVADNPPVVEPPDAPVPGPSLLQNRKNAIAELDTQKSMLIRAILAVLLEEINNLRAAAKLPPRTANDLKNAIHNKINSGAADK